jgi:hypothetical protein
MWTEFEVDAALAEAAETFNVIFITFLGSRNHLCGVLAHYTSAICSLRSRGWVLQSRLRAKGSLGIKRSVAVTSNNASPIH